MKCKICEKETITYNIFKVNNIILCDNCYMTVTDNNTIKQY